MTIATTQVERRSALRVLMPGFAGLTLPPWIESLLHDGLGGVCIFAHNVESVGQLRRLTDAIHAANPEAIVSIDEEGGEVSRLHQHGGSPFPGNAVLGRLDDPETTRSVAREVARQLADVRIFMTFAPDADVNSNPDNPVIGVRSFGSDPGRVATHTAAWIAGVQGGGVAACAKHFPGHGDTSVDSHKAVPVVHAAAEELSTRELPPFRAAIAAGVKAVMTSHILVPALDPHHPATFSSAVLGGLLREDLGFDGAIVTDALDMLGASGGRGIPAAAVAALAAGADLLCLGSNNSEDEIASVVEAIITAVNAGTLPLHRLRNAVERCDTLERWLVEHRAAASRALGDRDGRPVVAHQRIVDTFTMSARAREAIADGPLPVRWINLEPEPNIAIGATPFGPFFDGGAVPEFVVPFGDRTVAASIGDAPGVVTVVVGRELHREPEARRAASAIASRSSALVVDMGFAPVDDVDIATFGASRLVGEALLRLLGER